MIEESRCHPKLVELARCYVCTVAVESHPYHLIVELLFREDRDLHGKELLFYHVRTYLKRKTRVKASVKPIGIGFVT